MRQVTEIEEMIKIERICPDTSLPSIIEENEEESYSDTSIDFDFGDATNSIDRVLSNNEEEIYRTLGGCAADSVKDNSYDADISSNRLTASDREFDTSNVNFGAEQARIGALYSFYPVELPVNCLILRDDKETVYTSKLCLSSFLYDGDVDFNVEKEIMELGILLTKSPGVVAWEDGIRKVKMKEYPTKATHFQRICQDVTKFKNSNQSRMNIGPGYNSQTIRINLVPFLEEVGYLLLGSPEKYSHFINGYTIDGAYASVGRGIRRVRNSSNSGSNSEGGSFSQGEQSISTAPTELSHGPVIKETCVLKVYNFELSDLNMRADAALDYCYNQVCHELEIYAVLEKLQGTIIPEVIGRGFLNICIRVRTIYGIGEYGQPSDQSKRHGTVYQCNGKLATSAQFGSCSWGHHREEPACS